MILMTTYVPGRTVSPRTLDSLSPWCCVRYNSERFGGRRPLGNFRN